MALLALSYPSISAASREWMQAIRKEYDPNYAIVAPHFTLVFPTFAFDQQTFCEHLRRQLQGQPPVSFVLRCALVVKDALNEQTHTFLVPDEGFSDIVKLHDRLYCDLLAGELRLDIPFIPHITVASSSDPQVCKRIADEINRQNPLITGSLRVIDIVHFANRRVTTLEQILLA